MHRGEGNRCYSPIFVRRQSALCTNFCTIKMPLQVDCSVERRPTPCEACRAQQFHRVVLTEGPGSATCRVHASRTRAAEVPLGTTNLWKAMDGHPKGYPRRRAPHAGGSLGSSGE